MKKGLMIILISIFLFTFLISGIFASSPSAGTCAISQRSECIQSDGNYIIMGLSDSTNAHGENLINGTYPDVLCCHFGSGNLTCTDGFNTPIVKLSSTTNAHAESPLGINYNTKVCYEDLQCKTFTSDCGTGDAAGYQLGILSLTNTTNAHIGNLSDYPTKICCKSSLFAGCTINNATWNLQNAVEGQRIYLKVTGNAICSGQSVSFKVFRSDGDASSITNQASCLVDKNNHLTCNLNVTFNGNTATGMWLAEHQSCGVWPFVGDCSYYFNASLSKNPLVNMKSISPDLSVSKMSDNFCANKTLCSDYPTELDCQSDVCNKAADSSLPEVDCGDPHNICGCIWDSTAGSCKFGWNTITDCGSPETGGCKYGCTLCHNQTLGTNYCNIGNTCPTVNDIPSCIGGICNQSCDFNEGCLTLDCNDGDQDTCETGTYCLLGGCSSVEGPPLTLGSCKIIQNINKSCDEEPVGYKIISWGGIWTNGAGEQITTTGDCGNDAGCSSCVAGGESTVPCPAQVQLPFFDYLELIISIIVIALIYVSLIFRRRFKKKK